jgi:hypothetical protein
MAKKNKESENKTQGRPIEFTQEIADRICNLIATHPIGYEKLKLMYPDIPSSSAVYDWRHRYESFSVQYLDAKRKQAELMVEEIDDMLPHDIVTYYDDKGNARIDAPSATMAIAKINNRKWMAARLSREIYGDHYKIESLEKDNESLKKEMLELRAQLDEKNKKDY